MRRWASHSEFTSPGVHGRALAAIGPDPERAAAAIQGLLIHGGALDVYGLPRESFDRATLPVEDRLAAILAADDRPLEEARTPEGRAMGTCRDYAVLLCAAMREHGRPARVRCGFASYFEPGSWQDHWICEVWSDDRWRRIDAQLDAVTRRALDIGFPPSDLPLAAFLSADEAWRGCRDGRLDPEDFGHRPARGLWFVHVDLVRDRLALADRLTSAWDGWRAVTSGREQLSDRLIEFGDHLAEGEIAEAPPPPWWLSDRV